MPTRSKRKNEVEGVRVPVRELREKCPVSFQSLQPELYGHDAQQLRKWLGQQARTHRLVWLLAFADDGVIWGRVDGNGQLALSSEVAGDVSPPLRPETLQELRLFNEQAELLLWKDGKGQWRARVLRDGAAEEAKDGWCFDEDQILWGTKGTSLQNGFTLMEDGEQGMRHVVPLDAEGTWTTGDRPLRLTVRHYVEPDDDGLLRVVASRLVKIYKVQGGGDGTKAD